LKLTFYYYLFFRNNILFQKLHNKSIFLIRKFEKKIKDIEKEEKLQAEKETQRLAKIREKEGIN
jgi:hypothetical protein